MNNKDRNLISFSALEDSQGVLYLVIYDDNDNNKISHFFTGYQNTVGKLSSHIMDLYKTDTNISDWKNDTLSLELEFVNDEYLKILIVTLDTVADEFGLYYDSFGISSDREFNDDRFHEVSSIILNV